ncbi:MAG: hypothetical protein E5W81_06185 [Mesorhizobium sp.]|nr:MAG: hypothetical protein E5V36_12590 [Mesorhizobium sp.]TKB92135.1 MAG: hypothetical protein E5W81_06185 [Mesorhizobium sp.]
MTIYTLDSPHFELFGRIISGSALVEMGLKITISGMLHSHQTFVHVLTAPYNSIDLYNVSKSMAKLYYQEGDKHRDELVGLIGRYKGHSRLRNHIAHAFWVPGSRDKSIRPASMSVREGHASGKGFSADEPDYTLTELEEAARDLSNLYTDLKDFLNRSGLAASIAENMADATDETEASDGA